MTALAGFYVGPQLFWLNWNLGCLFLWREETEEPGGKTLGARQEPTTNLTHIWHQARIKLRSHC